MKEGGAEAVYIESLAAGVWGLCPPEAVGNLGFMVPQTSEYL